MIILFKHLLMSMIKRKSIKILTFCLEIFFQLIKLVSNLRSKILRTFKTV